MCPNIGKINVYVQGTRKPGEVVVLTVHDLGCDHTMYEDFLQHPKIAGIRERVVWVHVDLPGQGKHQPDLPADYQFPRMHTIGEDLIHVLNHLGIKQVVCFGEGAGANILARFAMANIERVLGVCLLHCTGTTAGFMESLKDKVIGWKLEHIGMNPSAEAYLVLHRFGTSELSKATDREQLKSTIEKYQEMLRNKTNAKNLKKFVEAFLKRTNIADNIKRLKCPVLLVSGQRSVFNSSTRSLHQAILRTCQDKAKVEFIEVAGVANVLQEKPDKLAESFQYFLQGLGLVSSAPMHNIHRGSASSCRSMSMEEYDKPLRNRTMSVGSGASGENPPSVISPTVACCEDQPEVFQAY
jgi:pimeloyl-ACP methyl ester carboxylesterase